MCIKVEFLEVVADESHSNSDGTPWWSTWTEDFPTVENADKAIADYEACSEQYGKLNNTSVLFTARKIAIINNV